MPSWKTHILIGEKDGINGEIMRNICEIIDLFHMERIPNINPEHAEWIHCPLVIYSILKIENPEERIKSVKAALHHYMLDMIEKTKIIDVEYCKEGLLKLREYLKETSQNLSDIPIYGLIERWFFYSYRKKHR